MFVHVGKMGAMLARHCVVTALFYKLWLSGAYIGIGTLYMPGKTRKKRKTT
jgi:hypothetical protein